MAATAAVDSPVADASLDDRFPGKNHHAQNIGRDLISREKNIPVILFGFLFDNCRPWAEQIPKMLISCVFSLMGQ